MLRFNRWLQGLWKYLSLFVPMTTPSLTLNVFWMPGTSLLHSNASNQFFDQFSDGWFIGWVAFPPSAVQLLIRRTSAARGVCHCLPPGASLLLLIPSCLPPSSGSMGSCWQRELVQGKNGRGVHFLHYGATPTSCCPTGRGKSSNPWDAPLSRSDPCGQISRTTLLQNKEPGNSIALLKQIQRVAR